MIQCDIPGFGRVELENLLLDYNGTLACDGEPIAGVRECLEKLSDRLRIHVLTADTFGTVKNRLADYPCQVAVLPPGEQDKGKLDYLRALGASSTATIGNGANDALMLAEARIGIVVIQAEGAASKALLAADIVSTDIVSALELFLNPLRMTASLRS